jgi:hypothetical protein
MKKLLAIVVMGIIGWLVYFIWPTENRMVEYCAFKNLGMQDVYRVNINLDIKLSEIGDNYVSGIIECARELKENPKLFKAEYLKELSYVNLNKLFK